MMKRVSIALAVVLAATAVPLQADGVVCRGTGHRRIAQLQGCSREAGLRVRLRCSCRHHVGGVRSACWQTTTKNTLGSSGGDTDLGQWDLLGRLGFVGIGPVKTYLTGGITGRVASSPTFDGGVGDYEFSGTNPTAGVAAQVFVTNKLAIDGSALWTFGKFGDTGGYSTSRVEATGSRVSVGSAGTCSEESREEGPKRTRNGLDFRDDQTHQQYPRAGFSTLGLDPRLLDALTTLGYEEPTPIQRAAIPPLMAGRDVLAMAATGTGKTAAFALPLLHNIDATLPPRARLAVLVLVPTRELAMQVAGPSIVTASHSAPPCCPSTAARRWNSRFARSSGVSTW